MQTRSILLWAVTPALALAACSAPTAAHADPLSVYVTGLNNPYGLTFGPDGGLYIAEAGTGGATPAFTDGNGVATQFGDTGAVGEYVNGLFSTVITGLPSLGPATPGETTGLQGLTFSGSTLYGVFGLGAMPSQLATFVAANPSTNAADLGQLVSFNLATNTVTPVSDVASYETAANYAANNPDRTVIEANPYGVAALPGGGGFAVTDGGGNVALKVPAAGGAPSLLSVIPASPNPLFGIVGPPKYQSVPTGITLGPNGLLYVAEFGGFPAPAGGSSVFSLDPTTGAISVFASGFTAITGLTYGPNGDLYVLDASTTTYYGPPSPAQLLQYDPTTGTKTVLADLPTGPGGRPITYTNLIAGPDDALYLSSQGNHTPGSGQVLRYSLAVPETPSGALLALGLLPVGLIARKRRRA